ncbi:response regulator transcription factor [Sphingomonas abietis]|uniref:Response regulator transcription factor n=1 Tax=Sphingomonas abietis TaxID=3012344 RepID=A0ABY7NLE7_9SPHN|nr:response regulator transcription factor [Sphingomonas abietis]WBO21397.1 response regulator transcription factor [Sphingomonas abietis]
MRLLIVEDDLELAEAVKAGLGRRGLSLDHAPSCGDAEAMLGAMTYGAIVLDLGLSDGDGLDLLRKVRAGEHSVPIMILSARGDIPDRLSGLNAGADDYLVKPFDMDELAARLRALLRRGALQESQLTIGNLQFDRFSRELSIDGVSVGLSAREGEIMELLLRRPERVVTKRYVEDQLFGMDEGLGSNAVEVYIHRLRRKLEKREATAHIETIRGVGYILRRVE